MSNTTLTRQFILDANGKPIGVILPIEEYEALVQTLKTDATSERQIKPTSLFGILRGLGGKVASTESLDEARRALWSALG